jgi:Zn-dependent peptidase ImmA (M78 family)
MDKITVEEALSFAKDNFPKAPERLVEKLKIKVKYSPINTDGWCLQVGDTTIIRINSKTSKVRQRFTLAHELGHLICGVTSVADEKISLFITKTKEEKEIDRFAAELLLPESIVIETIKEIPVTAKVIQKFAKTANVSLSMVALRIASLAKELGLKDASVVSYENDEMKWQWSETLELSGEPPKNILAECEKAKPNPARIIHSENNVIVASFIENPTFNSKILFLQLVNESDGFKELREEKIRDLEAQIFQNDTGFRQSINGKFGAFKGKAKQVNYEDSIKLFNEHLFNNRYESSLTSEQLAILKSETGQEYIRLRLRY